MRFWGKTSVKLLIVILFFINITAVQAVSADNPVEKPSHSNGPVKIAVASDLHVYPAALHDDSEAYKKFEATGQGKMLSFSDHIVKAFIDGLLEEEPDAVIITGDLTLNGEKIGHEALAAELKRLKDGGIQVLVIPGNHDINNPSAREIKNNKFYRTDYVSASQFKDIYSEFYSPIYSAEDSLSYIARLNGYLYAIMLDTSVYEPNIKRNASIMGGTVNQGTLNWLEESVKEIKADNPSARFVTAMHHNLLQHHPGFDENYIIQSQDETVKLFAELGLSLTFSGHIHTRDELTEETLTEITNSSLIVFPFDYNVLEFTPDGGWSIQAKSVDMPSYALELNSIESDDFDFDAFTETVFERRINRRQRNAAYSEEDTAAARELMHELNGAFLNGDIEDASYIEEIKQSRGYQILRDIGMERGYLDYILR